jgi:hypothetical protein
MMSAEPLGDESALVTELVGDQAGAWELNGELPRDLLGEQGLGNGCALRGTGSDFRHAGAGIGDGA